jgi:hypothetical protein
VTRGLVINFERLQPRTMMQSSYYEQNGKSSSFFRTTYDAVLGLDRALRNRLINCILMGAGKAPAFPDQQKDIVYQYVRP